MQGPSSAQSLSWSSHVGAPGPIPKQHHSSQIAPRRPCTERPPTVVLIPWTPPRADSKSGEHWPASQKALFSALQTAAPTLPFHSQKGTYPIPRPHAPRDFAK